MGTKGRLWESAVGVERVRPRAIVSGDIPTSPGVYIWFRDGSPVYVGVAKGAQGLRGRLRAHLATGTDLSRSTLRASVAVAELGFTRAHARQRPTLLTTADVTMVNDWLAGCELGWYACTTATEARELEAGLLSEWRPPLNIH